MISRQLVALSRRAKQSLVMGLDAALALAATWLAFSLRLDMLHWPLEDQWKVYGLSVLLALPVFIRFGLYRAIFRYTGIGAMVATAKAVAVYAALLAAVLFVMRWPMVPRSLALLQPLIFLLLVAASRALARFWLLDLESRASRRSERPRLLIYGAGAAGVQTANAVGRGQFELVGFVDDDAAKVGRSINGVTVFAPEQVPDAAVRLGVTDILLALPSASRQRRNDIIAGLRALPVHIRTLPSLGDLATGRVTVQDFQELDIEDLLGRDAVLPDPDLLAELSGRTVMVTGAGGSIGSELCRQILMEGPARLLLVDHAEYNLYAIHQELEASAQQRSVATELVPLLASVTHEQRMADLFSAFRPHTVFHAAAYKHVPLVEQNPGEGVANNVFGTLVAARAAQAYGTSRFVLISTDKAVRPTNVMGASKRVAELVLQALAKSQASGDGGSTVFGMVRFGNVLGSSGSVVPLFRRQLAAGGPLTVTHADVTRYFMTIPEAAQLVLQAGAMAEGGEVFVLDMGAPVRILDLAHRMVRLSGLSVRDAENPTGDIEIAITGLRPGEKLYEELLIGDDPQPTAHPRIMKAREGMLDQAKLDPALAALRVAIAANDVRALARLLEQLVSGYTAAATADHLHRTAD